MNRDAGTEIGFVWLCFFRLRPAAFCRNILSQKILRPFVPSQIGFVFSTWVQLNVVVSDLELSASDFRPKASKLALFSVDQNRQKSSKSP
jgi:hypothetical protein